MTTNPVGSGASRLVRQLARIVSFATVACAISIMTSYVLRLRDTAADGGPPATAVIFTGQFDRIELGLSLLERRHVGRLFISGVNEGAGLNAKTFPQQFALSADLRAGLNSGAITLATEAHDTIENALETSCWLMRHADNQSVVLVTSHLHMPRASLLLERAAGIRVGRLSAGLNDIDMRTFLTVEFWRFAATWFMTFLPPRLWPARSGFSCLQP